MFVAFAQILVRGRMSFNIHAGITHLSELFPGDRI